MSQGQSYSDWLSKWTKSENGEAPPGGRGLVRC